MSLRFAAALAAFSLSPLVSPVLAQAPEPVPLSEYGKLPDIERTAISPSGDRIAVLATIGGRRMILAIEDQSTVIGAFNPGESKVRSLSWIGEDRLMLVTSQTQDLGFRFTTDKAELYTAQILPLDKAEEARIVFGDSPRYPDVILGNYGVRESGGTYFGFFGGIELQRSGLSRGKWELDHARPYLFKVNLESGDVEKIANSAPPGEHADWLIDASGEVAYSLQVNDDSGRWEIRGKNGDRIAYGQQPRGSVALVGIGSDGTSAIYYERGEERLYWYEIDQTGGPPRLFLDDVDFNDLFFDPQTGRLMGYSLGEDENERHVFFDPALQTKADAVRRAFSRFENSMIGWTSDLGDVIVRTSGNGDSGTVFAVNLETLRANALAYERTAITPEQVGAISTFEYLASDGTQLDGILTLPPGREAKDLPVVIMPHGGPHSADGPSFDWWAQAFASRGYAVFQPNFRGSTNRDAAFRRAGYGEWGRKMQTDKSDGLMALAEAGIVDSERACIVGASYGGYAALAGVTVQQGIYKCAVAVAPVSDIRDMYNEDYRASGRDRTTRTGLHEQLGDPSLWDDVSPLRLATRADAPILLIHGENDTVVPYSHSSRMADKLKDAGKPYQLVTLAGEDHWLSQSETRQRMLAEAVAFVQEHNPAD